MSFQLWTKEALEVKILSRMAKIKSLPKSTSHRYKPKGVTKHDFHKVHWPYLPAWALVSFGAIVGGAAEFGATGAMVGGLSVFISALALAL
jgi:hypothetical protein